MKRIKIKGEEASRQSCIFSFLYSVFSTFISLEIVIVVSPE